jgi:large subunit ribosomal protein L17
MFRNMVTSLIKYDRITTTDTKAKALRGMADRLITLAKRGDLHARRQAMSIVREKDVVHKLFETANERFGAISGGYTRVVKAGFRPGDAARMAIIELVTPDTTAKKKPAKKKKAAKEKAPAPLAAAATDASAPETTAAEETAAPTSDAVDVSADTPDAEPEVEAIAGDPAAEEADAAVAAAPQEEADAAPAAEETAPATPEDDTTEKK